MSSQLDEKTWKAVLRVAQSDEDKSNRCLALRILAKSPSDCRKCVQEFVDILGEESWEFRVPLRMIFETIDQKEIVSALIRVTEENEGPKAALRRANALYQLKSFWRGKQLDEMVLKACNDREAIVQKTAVEILNHTEYAGGAKFVPAMIHLAQHRDDQTAMLAVRVLGRSGKDAETARPLLLKMLRERKDLRAEVIRALNGLKPRDSTLVSVLIPYLDEKEDGEVVSAVLASVAFDHRPKEALQPLIRLLARKDLSSYGNYAVVFEALAKYGPEATAAVPHLKKLLIDYSSLRRPIAACLDKIDPVAGKEALDYIRSREEAEEYNRLNPKQILQPGFPDAPAPFPEK